MSERDESRQLTLDEMDEEELVQELHRVGWDIGHTDRCVTLTFRKSPDTWSRVGAPGTRTATGVDDADAIRTFLEQLGAMASGT